MENIFQFVGWLIFGKQWLLWGMKNGYKSAIFVNEVEIDMQKQRLNEIQERKAELESGLAELEAEPLKEASTLLTEEEMQNKKLVYDTESKIQHERNEQLETFRNRIKSVTNEELSQEGELQRIYHIAYSNRRKFDFIKEYKIKKTYADKGYAESIELGVE